MNLKIKNILPGLKKHRLDALILSLPENIAYLTGFRSRESYLLISQKKNIYFTDSRYFSEAKINLKGCLLKQINGEQGRGVDGSLAGLIQDASRALGIKRLGFEEKYLSFHQYKNFQEKISPAVQLIPVSGVVEELREIKSAAELIKIKKAVGIAVKAMEFARDFIRAGRKEIEVAGEIERFIRYAGASASAFEMIIASGPNSASPHHFTSQRKIKNNEPVLVDIGVDYSGYKSDLTRVFRLGKISPLERRIYDLVLKAQTKAIETVEAGICAHKVDAAARQFIARRGFGGFFGHSLGHGIGQEVHEGPRISRTNKEKLRPGMVFTVEPGIYLPQKFGIRIEDIILVTKKGVEVLSGDLDK